MRAMHWPGNSRVEIVEVPIPVPGPGEILLRVEACALCGSDRRGFREGSSVVPGHEIAAVVEALGPGLTEPTPGVHGVVFLVRSCGECQSCETDSPNRCLDRLGMYGFTEDGGFADHVVVAARSFLPIPAHVRAEAATSLLDLFGTTAHALRGAKGNPPPTLMIVGCGPIGLGAIAVARAMGIPQQAAVDVVPSRLKIAQRLGATTYDISGEAGAAPLIDQRGGMSDLVLEAAGTQAARHLAIKLAAPGGTVVMVAHGGDPLDLAVSEELIEREISLVGSEYFRPDEFAENLEMIIDGRLDPTALITHRFALDEAGEACRVFFGGKSGKVVVCP
jgi:threonine 3-dehydrogenase